LLVPRGDSLTIQVPAAINLSPLIMPRGMLAAFVKRAASQNPNAEVLKQTYEKGKAEGIELGQRRTTPDARVVEDAKHLRESIAKFAKETGINPEYFYDATLLKKAMALVRTGKTLGNAPANLRTVAHQLRNALGAIDEAVAAAETIGRELSKELNATSTT
jgi:predicted urease superfamily metal-dependent hydrolase